MKHTGTRLIALIICCLSFHMCSKEQIPEPLSLVLITSDVTSFRGSDGFITLEVEGGVAPYAYLWSTGQTTKDIGELQAGIYSVTVTDAIDSVATAADTVNQPIPDNIVFDIQGNIYPVVEIGDQIWMQQNLRVTVDPDSVPVTSYVYPGQMTLVETHGRLYTWDVAMNFSHEDKAQGICPDGWHVPSDEEWKILEIYLGMTREEADLVNLWRGTGVGTKLRKGGESGYETLYSGRRSSSGAFSLLYYYEYIWTSSEYDDNYAWRRCLDTIQTTSGRFNTFPKSYAFSVRCIKDNNERK
jgi:uncharacterized protein (TIGR02145 family)